MKTSASTMLRDLVASMKRALSADKPPGDYGECFADCNRAGYHDPKCVEHREAWASLHAALAEADGGL